MLLKMVISFMLLSPVAAVVVVVVVGSSTSTHIIIVIIMVCLSVSRPSLSLGVFVVNLIYSNIELLFAFNRPGEGGQGGGGHLGATGGRGEQQAQAESNGCYSDYVLCHYLC